MQNNNVVDLTPTGNSDPKVEFFTLAGIAAALGASATLGGRGWELLHHKEPFIARVIDSYPHNGLYRVELQLQQD